MRITRSAAVIVAIALAGAANAAAQSFTEREVTFTNGPVTLAGTLTIPAGPGPFPAVVLLTGSGPQNRDEELMGFKPFKLLAEHLATNGIAVLRYDDRGVGGSTGKISDSTTEDFAADALAGVSMLAALPEIRAKQIGLAGHSEGAVAAAVAAAQSPAVAFIGMLAGTAVPGDEALRKQANDLARAGGADDAQVEKILTEHRRLTEGLKANVPDGQMREIVRALARAQIEAAPEAQRKMITDPDAFVASMLDRAVASVNTRWMKAFVALDPAKSLARVSCPVFAAFGGRDIQVPVDVNRPALEQALTKAGNTRVTVKVYADANHLFQAAKTGLPAEYATLEKQFVPGLLDDLTSWIRGNTR